MLGLLGGTCLHLPTDIRQCMMQVNSRCSGARSDLSLSVCACLCCLQLHMLPGATCVAGL